MKRDGMGDGRWKREREKKYDNVEGKGEREGKGKKDENKYV